MWASITLLAILLLDLGYSLAKHGEYKENKYNFWASLMAAAIYIWLYYEAGLFDVFKK